MTSEHTKVSQESVHLRESTGLAACGNCDMFIPTNACVHVRSGPRKISYKTLCDDYEAIGQS